VEWLSPHGVLEASSYSMWGKIRVACVGQHCPLVWTTILATAGICHADPLLVFGRMQGGHVNCQGGL
jgi:hypothetical protein